MIKWLRLGFGTASLLLKQIPEILEDGQVTLDEGFGLLSSIFSLFGVPVKFTVPDEVRSTIIAAIVEQ